ncbi:uncharacterized protein TEOVI_000417700 [Trypanosoma equiperdum]|uniref:Flagellar-associated PapD-like n=1 Tax=Trypanosoma equiperdum TaxID=5694 RepID=A0A1G4IJB7_TRYEQ|nr:hypothetical protein, conserved [Trypanosoma equiperdum]
MSFEPDGREQRKRTLGVDCVGRLLWRHWEPGGEYTQRLRIRNLDMKKQTIVYRLPLRKTVFIMDFPDPVTLSSGMATDIKVSFRPTELVDICDMFEVTVVGRGSFFVKLEGKIPTARVEVPPHHDFGYVPTATTAREIVAMKNVGTTTVSYEWEVPAPFGITPTSGELRENETVDLCITFTPSEACVLIAQAVCKMAACGSLLSTIKISGVAKYPFIRVSKEPSTVTGSTTPDDSCLSGREMQLLQDGRSLLLDFGTVYVGKVHTMEFDVENPSVVDAVFSLEVEREDFSCPFTAAPRTGVIPRGKAQKFKVTFAATSVGAAFSDKLCVKALAGNTVTLLLRGVVVAPTVVASVTSMNFGDIRMEKNIVVYEHRRALRRSFYIKNLSDVSVNFYVLGVSPGASFVVTPTTGELPAKGTQRMWVEFCPTYPMNYLRRLHIIMNLTRHVVFVDLFGSAYDDSIRPMSFGLKEVEEFFWRHEVGLGASEPQDLFLLSKVLRGGKVPDTLMHLLSTSSLAMLRDLHRDPTTSSELVTGGCRKKSGGRISFARWNSSFSTGAPFVLSTEALVFVDSRNEPQYVNVYNRSNTVATAYWCLPTDCSFSVTPMQEDILPHSYCTFTVTRSRAAGTSLRDQHLECYVNYKQMQSFLLIEEGSFTPPHYFTVHCQQIIQCSDAEAGSIVSCVGAPKHIVFPKCLVDGTTHTVIELENRGGVIVSFAVALRLESQESKGKDCGSDAISGHGSNSVFGCNPVYGIIPARSRVPLMLSFSAKGAAWMRGEMLVQLSNSPKDELRIVLHGEGFRPELLVEDSSMITMRPACVTGVTERSLRITNPTTVPISFESSPSQPLQGVVFVEPPVGVLQAGMGMNLVVSFCPQDPVLYEGHITFSISTHDETQPSSNATRRAVDPLVGRERESQSSSCNNTPRELSLRDGKRIISCPFMGEGRQSVVEVEPVVIEHEGPAAQEKTFEWTIYNSSVCEVCYEVRWLTKTRRMNWEGEDTPMIHLSNNRCGALAARSHTVVLVTLRPPAGVTDCILYTLVGGRGVDLSSIACPTNLHEVQQHPHCEVRLKGTRPAVQITDVRSLQQHRSQLWCQLAINSINNVLAAPVQSVDVERDSFAFPQYVQGVEPIYMDVGVGCVDDDDKEIMLCVENAGSCAAPFRFWYPIDHEGGNETWFVEDEELEDVQQILSNRLLEISPREGTIPVNSHAVITITYRHVSVGTHCLPVLLRLDKGKKALLVLEGRTVADNTHALAFHHPPVYQLHPIALGDVEPPLQSSTIENTSSHPMTYVVQEDLVEQVCAANCGVPVFQCMNPEGVIPPGGSTQLHWYFRPLEVRTYTIDVGLQIVNGEGYSMRFCGVGYHPKKTSTGEACNTINDAFLPIPVSPSLRLPSRLCPVSLSIDVMRIGAVPRFSLHRRICYVENRHNSFSYSFSWATSLEPGSSTISVSPNSGVVRPGQRVRCVLALQCGKLSQIIEAPIFCRVVNETLIEDKSVSPMYVEAAAAPEDEEADEEDDTDPLLDVKPQTKTRFERSTCTKRRATYMGKKRPSVIEAPPEYQSLRVLSAAAAPALHSGVADHNTMSLPLKKRADEGPVLAHSLEVLVQARIMPVDEYQRLYGECAVRQVYFPPLYENYVRPQSASLVGDRLKQTIKDFTRGNVRIVRRMLEGLLRTVVDCPPVRNAFTETIKEEIPQYRELVSMASNSFVRDPPSSTYGANKSSDPGSGAAGATEAMPPTTGVTQRLTTTAGTPCKDQGVLPPWKNSALLNLVEKLLNDVAVRTITQDMGAGLLGRRS